MKLLFKKGDRGLAAVQSGGKFCFPLRGGNITTEGVYECVIAVDKESYCFVDGVKIEVPKISDCLKEISELIVNTKSKNNKRRVIGFTCFECGGELLKIYLTNGCTTIGYYDSVGFNTVVAYYPSTKHESGLQKFYDDIKFKHPEVWSSLFKQAELASLAEIDDVESVVAAAIFETTIYNIFEHVEGISVYGKKIIEINADYNGESKCFYYGYDATNRIVVRLADLDSNIYCGWEKRSLCIEDIVNWLCDNFVTCKSYSDDVLKKITVEFQDEHLDIYAVNHRNLLYNLANMTNEDRQKVAESKRRLVEFRKSIAKTLTAKTASDLKYLSDKYLLGYDQNSYIL